MKLITEVKYVEVPDNHPYLARHELQRSIYEMNSRTNQENFYDCSSLNFKQELVKGITYKDTNGNSVNIGTSKAAQEVIGIQYDYVEKLISDIKYTQKLLTKELIDSASLTYDLESLESAISNASLWDRVIYLFTGRLPKKYTNENSI